MTTKIQDGGMPVGVRRAEEPKLEQPKVEPAPPPPPKPAVSDSFNAVAPKTPGLQEDPGFNKLDASTQKSVLDGIASLKAPGAQKNLADLAKTEGFQKLPPDVQAQVVKTLLKNPGDAAYAADLKALVNDGGPYATLSPGAKGPAVKAMQEQLKKAGFDPGRVDGEFDPKTQKALEGFQGAHGLKQSGCADQQTLGALNGKQFSALGAKSQTQLLQQLANHPADPGARYVLTTVAHSAGFRALPEADRQKLLALVGGSNPDLSAPARQAMGELLKDPKFAGGKSADQWKLLKDFVKDEKWLPGVVSPQEGAFETKRAKYKLTGPVEQKDYEFDGGKATALKYEVEIDGKKVPVYVAKDKDAKLTTHSIEQVAKGLAALPKSSRDLVKAVNVEGKPNPDDAYWAKKYNTPGFSSYMAAGAEGKVSIYPSTTAMSQSYLDGTMIHETGHTLSKQKWGEDTDKKWDDWRGAMKKDVTHASAYAKNSESEDFAETLQLYQQVKGTPQEAEVRAVMPERFKIIDDLLAGKR
jgi:peptidoglycan hydrolase-like protein with peptidoglycan-binding domain